MKVFRRFGRVSFRYSESESGDSQFSRRTLYKYLPPTFSRLYSAWPGIRLKLHRPRDRRLSHAAVPRGILGPPSQPVIYHTPCPPDPVHPEAAEKALASSQARTSQRSCSLHQRCQLKHYTVEQGFETVLPCLACPISVQQTHRYIPRGGQKHEDKVARAKFRHKCSICY